MAGTTLPLAADSQFLSPLGTAAFEHQAAVFRGHTAKKPVRFGAMPIIRLERANTLGHCDSFGE